MSEELEGLAREVEEAIARDFMGNSAAPKRSTRNPNKARSSLSLLIRQYISFSHHKCKRNLAQAEEYYSRAILADPDDAETISQYGKLIWDLHADFERASAYIERAVYMDQNNCFVQATYASFLWETGEEVEEEDDRSQELCGVPFLVGTLASAGA